MMDRINVEICFGKSNSYLEPPAGVAKFVPTRKGVSGAVTSKNATIFSEHNTAVG